MPSSVPTPRRRITLALLAGLLLVSLGGGSTFAQDPSAGVPSPETPVSGSPVPSPAPGDGAIPAIPDPTVTGAQPVPFDHVVVAPDGRTLTIYFWNGVEACYGLKDVQVVVDETGLTITIWAGMRADAATKRCIAMAQLYSTQVVLDEPIFRNGGLD